MTRRIYTACLTLALSIGAPPLVLAQQSEADTAPLVAADASDPLGLEEGEAQLDQPVAPRRAGELLPFAVPLDLPDQASTPLPAKPAPSLLGLEPLRADMLDAQPPTAELLPPTQDGIMDPVAPTVEPKQTGLADELVASPSVVPPTVIKAQQLSSQDVASIGLLTEADSGYSTQIWRGSTAADIVAGWQGAPVMAPSPIIQKTLGTLAVAVASAPRVSSARAWALLETRIDALTQIGDLDGAIAMLARAPSDLAPTPFLRKKANIALWAQNWAMACQVARIGIDRSVSRYWIDLSLACHAMRGNRGAVDLLLETLGPGEQPSRALMSMVSALLDKMDQRSRTPLRPVPASADSPLLSALSAALNQRPSPGPGFLDEPALSHARAAMAINDRLASRWPGVAALAYRGRIDAADLLQFVVAAPPTTPGDPSLGVAPRDLQQPLRASNAQRRIGDLLDLSRRAGASGISQFWGPSIGLILKDIEPQNAFWPDAGAIAAHIAFAGEGASVIGWYNHIRSKALPNDLQAAQSLISIWPYAIVLAGPGEVPFTSRIAQLWWQTQAQPNGSQGARQAAYVSAALEAFGYALTPEDWTDADVNLSILPGGFDAAALERAVQRSEVGRGILLSLAALGDNGTVDPNPAAFKAALQALMRLGQDRLARQLAAEVLYFSKVAHGRGP